MNRKKIGIAVLAAVILFALVVALIVVPKNQTRDQPDESGIDFIMTPPDQSADIPPIEEPISPSETTNPPNTSESDGGIHIDVGQTNGNGHTDEPGIIGNVSILPGVKEGEK